MTRGLEAHLSKGAGEMYLYDLGGDRSLPRNDLHPDSYTKNARRGKTGKGTRSHPTTEFLSSTRSLLRDAATSMQI